MAHGDAGALLMVLYRVRDTDYISARTILILLLLYFVTPRMWKVCGG
mgnify:CR=1 FL=1